MEEHSLYTMYKARILLVLHVAYEVYMSSGSEETEANRSVVLTAQAMGAFANQDRESCKLFLFEA